MNENETGELIGVKEAARRLGVHENSIRNWANRGILPARYLPDSGFRRFQAGDVEQLKQAVATGRLERLFRSATAITTGELDRLLTVARMYLDVFAGSNQLTPAQQQLYQDIEGIVARYGEQENAA